jgi:thioredoxin 2
MAVYRCPECGKTNNVDASRVGQAKCGQCKSRIDATNAPFHVSDDELAALVASSPVPVLVDFYADWCGPCRTLAPILVELARNNAGKLLIAKVDTEQHKRTAGGLGVQGIPALFLYKGGRVVNNAAGLRPLPALQSLVTPHL